MEATVLSMTSDSFCLFYTVLTPKSAPLSILSCPCFSWIIFLLISKRSWIDVFFSFPVIALFCATGFLSAFPVSLTAVFASTPALDTRRPGHGLHGVWNPQGAVLLSADRPIQRRTPLGGKRSAVALLSKNASASSQNLSPAAFFHTWQKKYGHQIRSITDLVPSQKYFML